MTDIIIVSLMSFTLALVLGYLLGLAIECLKREKNIIKTRHWIDIEDEDKIEIN